MEVLFFVYPEGDLDKARTANDLWHAKFIAWRMGILELWRMMRGRGAARRIVTSQFNWV